MTTPPEEKKPKKKAKAEQAAEKAHEAMTQTQGAVSPAGKRFARRSGDIHQHEEGSAIWLVSFTDVMALMLTFFVMLFAMSEPEKESWSDVMLSLESELNSYYGPALNQGPQETINLAKVNLDRALDIGYLNLLIKEIVEGNDALADAVINRERDHLVISLPDELLFDAGSSEPKDAGLRALYALGGPLTRIKNRIEIVGHTDPRPVGERNEQYDSNWDLSLARALNVAAVLENVGYDKHVTVQGLSDGRYKEIGNSIPEEQRLALSRRVDIVVMDHDGSKDDIFGDTDFK